MLLLLLFALFVIGALGEQLDKTYVPAGASNVNQPSNYPYGYTPNYPYKYSNIPSKYSYYSSAYPLRNYPLRNYPPNSNYPYSPNASPYYQNGYHPYNPSYPNTSPYYQNGYPYNSNYPYTNRYYNGVNPSYNGQARILRYDNNNDGTGNYQFHYETENGIKQQEVGQLKHIGSPDPATVVQGSYSYVAPNGQTYTVNYVADENGFQPSGSHIPLQKSYLNNPYAAYRRYYDTPQYVSAATNNGYKY